MEGAVDQQIARETAVSAKGQRPVAKELDSKKSQCAGERLYHRGESCDNVSSSGISYVFGMICSRRKLPLGGLRRTQALASIRECEAIVRLQRRV